MVATALTAADPYDLTGWRTLFLLSFGLYVLTWFLYFAFVKIQPLPFDPRSQNQPINKKIRRKKTWKLQRGPIQDLDILGLSLGL